jgi:hypothetical protein
LILGVSVPLLQPTFELVALAVDGGQIIVRQFPPLRFDLAFDLFPISFNPVPVRDGILRMRESGNAASALGFLAVA